MTIRRPQSSPSSRRATTSRSAASRSINLASSVQKLPWSGARPGRQHVHSQGPICGRATRPRITSADPGRACRAPRRPRGTGGRGRTLRPARSRWDPVEVTRGCGGLVPPRRQTRGLTDIVSVDSPMGLPNGSGRLTIGGQEAVDAQVCENGSTMHGAGQAGGSRRRCLASTCNLTARGGDVEPDPSAGPMSPARLSAEFCRPWRPLETRLLRESRRRSCGSWGERQIQNQRGADGAVDRGC